MMRARQSVETAMNGDVESIDPAIRRSMLILADHIDSEFSELKGDIAQLKKTVMGTGAAIILALVTAAISVIIQ